VTEEIEGMEVGLFKQTSELPWPTVITGVSLPFPLESLRKTTTLVPTGIVTRSQVYEVPVTPVKAATTGPSALPLRKERLNGARPLLVSYWTVKGSQVVMLPGDTTWNALATEARRERVESATNFMAGA